MVREPCFETTSANSMVSARASKARAGMTRALRSIIVPAGGIHGVKRRRTSGGVLLEDRVNQGQYGQGGESRHDQAANYGAAERSRLRPALTESDGQWDHSEDHGRGGHQDRAQSAGGSFARRFE